MLIGKTSEEQFAQRVGKVSILSNTQNITGHSPEQAALVDPTLIRGFELEIPSRQFSEMQTSSSCSKKVKQLLTSYWLSNRKQEKLLKHCLN